MLLWTINLSKTFMEIFYHTLHHKADYLCVTNCLTQLRIFINTKAYPSILTNIFTLVHLKSILDENIFIQKVEHPDHVSILKFDDSYS